MPTTRPADHAPPPVDAGVWLRARQATPPIHHPLPAQATVLVLAAHPDDEAIGAGRLLADHDGPVYALTLTAGELCHGPASDPDLVRSTRVAEWHAALAVLGATPLPCPGLPDGRLAAHEGEATRLVTGLVAVLGAAAVVAPWRYDPHPDHGAAGRVGTRAAMAAGVPLWAYCVWAPYWMTPDELGRHGAGLVSCPTSPAAEDAWRRAVACHHSQLTPHPPATLPVVPAELLARHDRQLLIQDTHADPA